MDTLIDLEITENKGSAFFKQDGKKLAEMTFSLAGDSLMIIDHTEVDESLRGQGVGRKLLDRLLQYSDNESRKIMPLCPYAKSVFDKEPALRKYLRHG